MERYLLQREQAFVRCVLKDAVQPYWLLEVCSGDGWMTLPLHKLGMHSIALDMNPIPLELLRTRSRTLPLVQADAVHLPFTECSLDCIVAIQCLHFLDRNRFLEECSRILCTQGLLVFESVNRHSYKWLHRRLRRWLSQKPSGATSDQWLSIPSSGEILRTMASHGFEIQAVSGYGWIPFPRHSNSAAVDTLARVEKALQLDRWYSVSPRILVAARKIGCA